MLTTVPRQAHSQTASEAVAPAPSQASTPTHLAPPANPVSWGTGFVVSEGHLLTSLHLVRDKTTIFVGPVGTLAIGQPRWVVAELVRTDPALDLALIKARIDLPALALHPTPTVPLGLEISVIGFPQPRIQGMSKKITQGIVNGYRSPNMQAATDGLMQISAEVSQGNSGGPVLAPDGTVVGMVQSKLNATQVAERTKDLMFNVSFALRSSELIRFLQGTAVQPLQRSVSLQTHLRPYQIFEQSQASVLVVMSRGTAPQLAPR
ncbi:serine protease [Limnohabitans sp. 15K]|uniref:S1 family peptidase n=1 Tax=Limnohabitans sp. 15K TaxID=1100706 RepID=UPI0013040144|nr:serine protease [Limnohabitans sp. 15K]